MDTSTLLTLIGMAGTVLVYLIGLTVKGASSISDLRGELAAATAANATQAADIRALTDRVTHAEAELIRNEGHRKSIHAEIGSTTSLIRSEMKAFGIKLDGVMTEVKSHMRSEERRDKALEIRLTRLLKRAGLADDLDD